ncbi:hypothetical protein CA601_41660 [Paraburkholderia hospita]|nr:hypothetical protein CA601_41660 [Paraburkholderia hospita]
MPAQTAVPALHRPHANTGKCAAAHLIYLRIATSTVCATTSPFDLLPHPEPIPSPPPVPEYF